MNPRIRQTPHAHIAHAVYAALGRGVAWFCAFMLVFPAPAWAGESGRGKESKVANVMSVWIVNFARLSEWPTFMFDNEKSPIVIGVLGHDEVGQAIESIAADVKIGERALQVRRFEFPEPAGGKPAGLEEAQTKLFEELRRCHVLYICRSEDKRISTIFRGVAGGNLLTVSSTRGFAASGGMLELATRNNRITFDANPEAIERSGVAVSSKLLRLARIQKTEKQGVRTE